MMKGRKNTRETIFTGKQWNELENQVLTFRYLMSGLPVPPSLMSSVISSSNFTSSSCCTSSSVSNLFPHYQHPSQFGSSYFQVGYGQGRKVDMEPGRCKRTDGKKWRCAKEAHANSKYCERHMHRSKSKAKKAVTNRNPDTTSTTTTSSAPLSTAYSPYPAVSYCPVSQSSYPNKFQPGNSTFYPFLSTQSSSSNVSMSVRDGGNGPNRLGLDTEFLDQPRKEETRYTSSNMGGTVGERFSGFEASKEHKNETVGEDEEEEHESQKLYHHFLGDWPSKLNSSHALGLYSTSN